MKSSKRHVIFYLLSLIILLKYFGNRLFCRNGAILISIVLNSYYGMPRGQIHINLPPEHPIMSSETIEIKMAAVSAKRSIVV